MRVTFHGVRGSCPCSGPQYVRYGGNTSCVALEVGDEPPIVFDLGTGLRPLGHELEGRFGLDSSISLTAFLTHLHWDHIIGLPFCRPILRFGGHMEVFGPVQREHQLGEVIDQVVVPPFFPVQVKELHGSIEFREIGDDSVAVGSAKVTCRRVPHVGATLGFRVEAEGLSVAFVSDHQQPDDRSKIAEAVLELCDGADLVIHDAQYTEEEFAAKATWGHSTVSYAVHVAAEAGAKELVLFHHDPVHTDDDMDHILDRARAERDASRLDGVIAAAEGLALELAPR
ncbi:MAG: MBL fold metallo-hydrolase [Acidimicrobiales bacterium]